MYGKGKKASFEFPHLKNTQIFSILFLESLVFHSHHHFSPFSKRLSLTSAHSYGFFHCVSLYWVFAEVHRVTSEMFESNPHLGQFRETTGQL